MKNIALFLDDKRNPQGFIKPKDFTWVVVRSYNEAVQYIKQNGIPEFISFDNDLGTKDEGKHFAHWLVNLDLDSNYTAFPNNFQYNVHSANDIARNSIIGLLDQYLPIHKQKNENSEKTPK